MFAPFSTLRLSERLALPLLLLGAVSLGLGSVIVGDAIERTSLHEVQGSLETDRLVIGQWLAQRRQLVQVVARSAAIRPELAAVLVSRSPEAALPVLEEAARVAGVPVAVVLDEAALPLSPLSTIAAAALNSARPALLQRGFKAGPLSVHHGNRQHLFWVQPIANPETHTLGALVMGGVVDQAWLAAARGLSRADLYLLEREQTHAPWRPNATAMPPEGLIAWAQHLPANGDEPGSRLPPGEQTLMVSALPVEPGGPDPVASVALVRSVSGVAAPWLALAQLAFGTAALGFAMAALMAWFQGRRLRLGLRSLTSWARASVDLEFPDLPPTRAGHDLRRLGKSLDVLRLHLRQRDTELRDAAFKDPLTLLANREQFRNRLGSMAKHLQAAGRSGAVVVLDLQNFKYLNDVLGHQNGDRLLRLAAQRLGDQFTSKHHVLARTGSNTFACMLPLVDLDGLSARVQTLMDAFDMPFMLDGQSVDLSVQAGTALFPEHGQDSNTLIAHAELAMFTARRQSKAWLNYEPAMDTSNPASLSLLSDLKHAIRNQELAIYIQPKVDAQSGRVTGGEALIRWHHPTRGMVPPDTFIPFAEQSGFIRTLSLWVVEESARVWRQLKAEGLEIRLSVNLSTRDLVDSDLPAKLLAIVERQQTPPYALILEVTESATMDDPQHARRTLCKLHDLGFRLSIDDFGTGYSSLAYLKDLPVDELKIDRSFVMNMEHNLGDAKIVRSTIDLAHNLGLKVVAEGLESPKAWKILAGLQCDQLQGYLISKPLPVAAFAAWARQWTPPDTSEEHLSTAFVDIL